MSHARPQIELLVRAGRLLLEHNESTGGVHRALAAAAAGMSSERCYVHVAYGRVAVSLGDEGPSLRTVHEIRYNNALQARVHAVLDEVAAGRLDALAALERLDEIERDTPRHPRGLAALLLGFAGAALAILLRADAAGAAVAGTASALGLLARQELGRRGAHPLSLPLVAAFLGATLGGCATRLGWTTALEQVLLVPALMLVPGPHLINGLLDLIDNHVPMSLARFGLAASLLLSAALGVTLGVELASPSSPTGDSSGAGAAVGLLADMTLAGVVACGFAVFYNTPWREVGLGAIGGMIGHGVRFLALDAGWRLDAATFLGGAAVGAAAALMARSARIPLAVVAFAGAVTMIPGLNIYRAFTGAVQLGRLTEAAPPGATALLLGNAIQATMIVGGLALGLILGEKLTLRLASGFGRGAPGRPADRA